MHRIAVVNLCQFEVISQSVKKTDKNDAEPLALYLAKELLPEVRMKERKQHEVSHLAQTRDLLVKQRPALKAKINNLLSAEGINLKRESLSSNKALERVLSLPLLPLMLAEVRVLVGQICSLSESIDTIEKMIEESIDRRSRMSRKVRVWFWMISADLHRDYSTMNRIALSLPGLGRSLFSSYESR